MCSCSSSAETPCAVSWPPSQSVSSIRQVRQPRRAAASAAATPPVPPPATSTSHSISSGAVASPTSTHGDAGIARRRHAHDVDHLVEPALHRRYLAIVLGSQSAICGKAITSPSAMTCSTMYGMIDRKMSPSVMSGGTTPLR